MNLSVVQFLFQLSQPNKSKPHVTTYYAVENTVKTDSSVLFGYDPQKSEFYHQVRYEKLVLRVQSTNMLTIHRVNLVEEYASSKQTKCYQATVEGNVLTLHSVSLNETRKYELLFDGKGSYIGFMLHYISKEANNTLVYLL